MIPEDPSAELGEDMPGVPVSVGEIMEVVDELLLSLQHARTVPLSGMVMVDRQHFEGLLQRLRSELPEELRAARWMIREREAFISKTNDRAHELIGRAKQKAAELVSETQIMGEAVAEANHLVRNAESQSMQLRLEAEDLVEESYEDIDRLLSTLLERVRQRRADLHRARPQPPEVPTSR